jgi:hypothetical protein
MAQFGFRRGFRRYNDDGTRAPPTYQDRVKRIYPRATCVAEGDGWEILANNGTGNVLARSDVTPLDAWKRAAAAIQPPRGPTA